MVMCRGGMGSEYLGLRGMRSARGWGDYLMVVGNNEVAQMGGMSRLEGFNIHVGRVQTSLVALLLLL